MSGLSVADQVKQVAKGEVSATELVQATLSSIESKDPGIRSFLSINESALESAKAVDDAIAKGESPGPLAGLPIAIKDGICVEGLRTTAGSKMLEQFTPPYNATVIDKLVEAGAIVVGKTNLDEFAMGSSTENSAFGISLNPWNSEYVSGGSSGGSGACVAADLVPAALGSDTGGSIRQPAAFCGITGLKPTYGRVSRYGLIAFASSLDQIGPMTRSALDSAILLNVLAGHDPKDSTSSTEPTTDYTAGLEQTLDGVRIGLCLEHFEEGLDPEIDQAVREAIKVLELRGAKVVDISLPNTRHGVATYYVIAPCEASSNLARYDGVRYTKRVDAENLEQMYCETRAAGFGDEVKRRIMLGTYALSSGYYDAYYLKASKVRRLIKQDYAQAFQSVDLILGPTTPTTAFKVGEHTADPLAMYLADIYTVSANLAGVPALSIPCGISSNGLPIGLQLQGNSFQESLLLRTGHQYQLETDWHTRKPNA